MFILIYFATLNHLFPVTDFNTSHVYINRGVNGRQYTPKYISIHLMFILIGAPMS